MINLNNGELDLLCFCKYNFIFGVLCNMVEVNIIIIYGKKSIYILIVKMGVV